MNSLIKIGIIGDYDGRPSHIATEEAIRHCAKRLGLIIIEEWLPTESLINEVNQKLNGYHGLWCAPGSPYKSMQGAVNAIRYARENDIPFIGTCGGFQHAVIEFARNVLKIKEIEEDSFDPYSPNLFISALSCSLIGQVRHIYINKNTKIYSIYGTGEIDEKFNCSFGVNRDFQAKLEQNNFKVAGTDEQGEARIMYLPDHRFYVATLFQPQLSSKKENPHPLILAFLSSASEVTKE